MYQDNYSSLSLALCVISVIVTSRITHRIGISMDGRIAAKSEMMGAKSATVRITLPSFHLLTRKAKTAETVESDKIIAMVKAAYGCT